MLDTGGRAVLAVKLGVVDVGVGVRDMGRGRDLL